MSIVSLTAVELCGASDAPQEHTDFDSLLWELCERVHASLGGSQTESTYQRCLAIELRDAGIGVDAEVSIQLLYRGHVVGTRRADMVLTLPPKYDVVRSKVILELKSVAKINEEHKKQLKYYMKYMNVDVGFVLNFPHERRFPEIDIDVVQHQIGTTPEAAPPKTQKTKQLAQEIEIVKLSTRSHHHVSGTSPNTNTT